MYEIVENHPGCPADQPFALTAGDSVVGYFATADAAQEHLDALKAREAPEPVDAPAPVEVTAAADAPTDDASTVRERPWSGVLMVEGEPTSDRRVMTNVVWRTLPLTLMWQRETSHGGMQTGGEFVVGRIDTITRDGNLIRGTGVIDLGSEDSPNEEGREVERLLDSGNLRGVSIEAAPADGTIEYDEENDLLIIDAPEIGAAAVVPFPAFREAYIELEEAVVASGGTVLELVEPEPDVFRPPADWFANPGLTSRSGLHVEEDGRIWGHLYGWGECHQGFANRCVQIPRGGSYSYIVGVDGRGVRCADGSFVQTGPVFISADHAATRGISWLAAKDHYAHTGLAAADVVCGEDEHGIWVAGMVRPGTPPELVHALTASGPSGDWRIIGGRLELIAVLMVNHQGYPALVASFSGGEPTALILRGQAPEHAAACSCGTGTTTALDRVLDRLGQFEATLGPILQEARARQAAQIMAGLEELDGTADDVDTDVDAATTRSLADLIAAGQST